MSDPHRSPPIDATFLARVRRHVEGNYSATEIAEVLGRKVDQVREAIRRMGGVAAIRGEKKPRRVETWMDGGF